MRAIALNGLAMSILSLLSERPMHPYEVAFCIKRRFMAETIKLNYGSLYHTFEQLERGGLVEAAETGREGRRPERTVYRLTERGGDEYRRSLEALIGQPVKEYFAFEAGLSLMHDFGPEQACAALRQRLEAMETDLAERRLLLETVTRDGLPRLFVIEHEHRAAVQAAEVEWVRGLIGEIESGKLEWVCPGAGRLEKEA